MIQRQQRKRRQPVLAHVIARDIRQACLDVPVRRLARPRRHRMIAQHSRQRTPAPSPRKIQTIQMRDLAIGPIAHSRRRKQ